MADRLTPAQRSWNMSRIKGKDTKPELLLRKLLFSLGFRYRVNYPALPGKPDIVFPKRKKVIFVHGCFWHRHNCQTGKKEPKSNTAYWIPKFERNKKRDNGNKKELLSTGWKVMEIWECELKDQLNLTNRIKSFLED